MKKKQEKIPEKIWDKARKFIGIPSWNPTKIRGEE